MKQPNYHRPVRFTKIRPAQQKSRMIQTYYHSKVKTKTNKNHVTKVVI